MSFRITPSNPPLPRLNLNTSGPEKHKCLCWMLVPAGLAGLIIIAMVGKGLGHMFLEEVNKCLSDSLSPPILDFWKFPGVFWWDGSGNCFVMFVLALPLEGSFAAEWERIWADGFILSRYRRIQLPRLRPTSRSLCCIFRWTLRATSNMACVLLH